MSRQKSTYLPPRTARFWMGYVSYQMGALLDHIKLPPEMVMLLTALLVGLGTGTGAVAFRYLIKLVGWIGYDWFPQLTRDWGRAYVVLMPAVGGLLVGLLVYLFAPEAKGHGVPEVMEAVALRGGRIRPVVALIKSLASSLCIGSGGSVGREGPIVQIGSALGSSVGQLLHLSDDRVRNLVACGAAGGIAATFNAPIAGVIFALEIILGEFNVRYFSTVVISSVTASVIGRAVFGDFPAFRIPMEYGVNSFWEYGIYAVLGALAALVGVLFVRLLYWSEDRFEGWKQIPPWLQPAVGGTLLGGLALAYPAVTGIDWQRMPQIYNVGYGVIEATLSNQLGLKVVIVLLVLKLIATSLTLGSGGSGGVFAPSLFMGAMLGASYELVVNGLFPGIAAPPGAYALVGMGAVFAASAHVPITAVIILFELTGDYRIILPLMLS
ncbi:MAG: chloride channel protein, partial [Anaerolineae bacterium]